MCTIEKLLGSGGQGEVYQAKWGDETVALKWYYPNYLESDSSLLERLKKVVQLGSPNKHFLWPIVELQ